MSFTTETVSHVRRSANARDSDGNDVLGVVGTDVITNVLLAPGDANGTGGNENTESREQVFVGLTAYLPKGVTVSALDQFIARGDTWDVYGQPQSWAGSPVDWDQAVALVRVEG